MDKGKMLNLLRKALTQDKRVVFAYAYGSFVREQSFRDIDVGIYLKSPEENPFVISSEIKTQLSRIFKKEKIDLTTDQFDIQIINHTPFTFLKRVFKEGILLIDHDLELRTDLVEYISSKYRECAGLLAEASLI